MVTNSSGGIGFFGLLQVMLIGLKLTGNTDLSWWWVLAPILCIIGIVAVIIGVVIIALVVVVLFGIVAEW
jgi:hypothetical protein